MRSASIHLSFESLRLPASNVKRKILDSSVTLVGVVRALAALRGGADGGVGVRSDAACKLSGNRSAGWPVPPDRCFEQGFDLRPPEEDRPHAD
jgi:hypothetical protein